MDRCPACGSDHFYNVAEGFQCQACGAEGEGESRFSYDPERAKESWKDEQERQRRQDYDGRWQQ